MHAARVYRQIESRVPEKRRNRDKERGRRERRDGAPVSDDPILITPAGGGADVGFRPENSVSSSIHWPIKVSRFVTDRNSIPLVPLRVFRPARPFTASRAII